MTRINLLPWREQKREHEQKIFLNSLLVSILTSVFILCAFNIHLSKLINNQRTRNQLLEEEINIFDAQIKEIHDLQKAKEELISKISAIRDLQSTRTLMVHLFDELTQVISPGVYVTKFGGRNSVLSISGQAKSSVFVADIMRNLESNPWIHNPQLHEVKKIKDQRYAVHQEFKLTCRLGFGPTY